MMVLYSVTTCSFSPHCHCMMFEKGMEFDSRELALYNKP